MIPAKRLYDAENEGQYRRGIEAEMELRAHILGPNTFQGAQAGPFYDYGGELFNVKHPRFGVKGDDSTNDATGIAAVFTAISDAGGGKAYFPKAKYRVHSRLSVPSNCVIEFAPGAELVVPTGSSFSVLDIDGKTNVWIRGGKVTKAAGATVGSNAFGINIRGASTDILVDGLTVEGFVRNHVVWGSTGTVAGTCERITFRKCKGINSPSGYGFDIYDCDGVMLDDCHGSGNWLDGFKLHALAKNVTVLGGTFNENGVSGAGDGADFYAGGNNVTVVGTAFDDNAGNGLTIKNGDLQISDPSTYGYVGRIQLTNIRCRNNTVGNGLNLNLNDQTNNNMPLVNMVTINGGLFEGNQGIGLYALARNCAINSPLIKDNNQHGIFVPARSFGVTITDPICIGNGRSAAGTYDGISISGARVAVRGGIYYGADTDDVGVEADVTALTEYTRYGVNVNSTASEVVLEMEGAQFNCLTQSQPWASSMISGVCLIHQRGTGVPSSVGAYGSIGSRRIQTDATTGASVAWVKGSGAPNAPLAGWKRVEDNHSLTDHDNSSTSVAPTSTRIHRLNVAITADRTITLGTTAAYEGIILHFVRTAASTGAFNWIIGGLKNLTTGTWCDVIYDGSAWVLFRYGAL
jgi:hypothetical protein